MKYVLYLLDYSKLNWISNWYIKNIVVEIQHTFSTLLEFVRIVNVSNNVGYG